MDLFRRTITAFAFSIICLFASAQYIADEIVAVVGKSPVLYSNVQEQFFQMKAQGMSPSECELFENLLIQKLMVTQARVDSLEVTDGEVEMQLDQRIDYFVQQIGSEEKLMEYFGKSILEMRDDMRDDVREQLLMQSMQREIIKDITITPSEVKQFYQNIPKDSIPMVEAKLEVNQIAFYPNTDEEALFEVRERLLKIRERILNGESFATLAVLYSEGPSASRGGDIGWAPRASLDPAYSKAAYGLKKNQVSKIVESSFGFHIIQLIDKADDRIHTRHILLKPKISPDEKDKAIENLDSLVQYVRNDSIKFETAALYYSHDEATRMNGGLRVNPRTNDTKFSVDEFPTKEYYAIRNLKVGEISEIFETADDKGKTVIKVLKVKSKIEAHRANLEQDYNMLQEMALADKKNKALDKWIEQRLKTTYFRIDSKFSDCNFRLKGWN